MSADTIQEMTPRKDGTLPPRPALVETRPAPIKLGGSGLTLTTFEELWRFATCLANSGLAPKGMEKVESLVIAIQMGLELGLTPMAAIQNVAIINGRPSLWGDAQLAVCRSSGAFDDAAFDESWEGTGDTLTAICTAKRIGGKPCIRKFGVADAKLAGLWGKAGPWVQYPRRMLQMRARSWALRDAFGDALRGFRQVEESIDEPRDITDEPNTVIHLGESATVIVDESQATTRTAALREALKPKRDSTRPPESEPGPEPDHSASVDSGQHPSTAPAAPVDPEPSVMDEHEPQPASDGCTALRATIRDLMLRVSPIRAERAFKARQIDKPFTQLKAELDNYTDEAALQLVAEALREAIADAKKK